MIEIMFLGTGSMYPTQTRSQACIFFRSGTENVLFDCGEGAQRQMRIAGLSLMKVDRIFITHWHGDHALGLGGVIQSLSASGRTNDLEIYGPAGTTEHVKHILKSFEFDLRYKVNTNDIVIRPGTVKRIFEDKEIAVDAMPVKHPVQCLAYSFIEKGHRKVNIEYTKKFGLVQDPILGKLQENKAITYKGHRITPKDATFLMPDKKVSYITDTSNFRGIEKIAKDANILICESTFSEELKEKAGTYNHLTANDAAEIAKKSGAKNLFMTHFSQRFTDTARLIEEAKKIFANSYAAKDFERIEVK